MVVKKSTKRTCVTCTAKGVSKDTVPLWSKKDGVYSMLPKVINCEDKYNPNKQELKEETPEIVGTEVSFPLKIQETDRWVFYWAAEPSNTLEGDKPEQPAESYGDESNRGLVKTDETGETTITINCPKLYKEGSQLYPRHVHYTVLTEDDVWATTIGTMEIMCKLNLEKMKEIVEKKTYLILNALSKEDYDKQHIPGSVLCEHSSLDEVSKKQRDSLIKQLIKTNLENLPLVSEFLQETESIKEIPIIVYCAHEECDASEKLAEHLYSCGYYNVHMYPGGIKEWFSQDEPEEFDLFEDAVNEENESVDGDDSDEDMSDVEDDSDDQETIVVDSVEYIHRLDESDEVLTVGDLDLVGIYKDGSIIWNGIKEYNEHVERMNKGGISIIKEGHSSSDEDESGDDDSDEELPSESDSESEEEDDMNYNQEFLQSKTVKELKELLVKLNKQTIKKPKKKDLINCLMGCQVVYRGGYMNNDDIYYGGEINQSFYNSKHRGWGFTFM